MVQKILEVEDMVAEILLDRISDNNSNCTDLNWIYCWFFLSLIHSFRKVFYFGKTKMKRKMKTKCSARAMYSRIEGFYF